MSDETDKELGIKISARFTPVGRAWPLNAWICFNELLFQPPLWVKNDTWYLVRVRGWISELEANQQGIYRKGTEPKENV